jgi:hypothetical protein
VLQFEAGDTLKFSCFVENESGFALVSWNEQVRAAEHCDLFGTTIGGGIPTMLLP